MYKARSQVDRRRNVAEPPWLNGNCSPASNLEVFIRTSGVLTITCIGKTPKIVRSSRQRQILRWLILGSWGAPLEVVTLSDVLWPSADGAAAASNFSSSIRRLRATLGNSNSVVVRGGIVGLNQQTCEVDLEIAQVSNQRLKNDEDYLVAVAQRLAENKVATNWILKTPPDNEDMAERIANFSATLHKTMLDICTILHSKRLFELESKLRGQVVSTE